MLEIDDVRAALSHVNSAEADYHSDWYLSAIDKATDPRLLKNGRILGSLIACRQLMSPNEDYAIGILSRIERDYSPHFFEGITEAYKSTLAQIDGIVADATQTYEEVA